MKNAIPKGCDREARLSLWQMTACLSDAPFVPHFTSDGFDICGEANDGKEAIELAEKLSADLI
jgi:hypothetical protein